MNDLFQINFGSIQHEALDESERKLKPWADFMLSTLMRNPTLCQKAKLETLKAVDFGQLKYEIRAAYAPNKTRLSASFKFSVSFMCEVNNVKVGIVLIRKRPTKKQPGLWITDEIQTNLQPNDPTWRILLDAAKSVQECAA